MKRLHRKDLWCWSTFNEPLDIDFNGFLWTRPDGNVLIDPVEMTPHDLAHLKELGGAKLAILTNSMHVRSVGQHPGIECWGPRAEKDVFPVACQRWLEDGDQPFPGLNVVALDGSKSPGELALVLDGDTLICGDLIRSHRADTLMLLMEPKLKDKQAALKSIQRMLERFPRIQNVLVGDGWHTFRHGGELLRSLAVS